MFSSVVALKGSTLAAVTLTLMISGASAQFIDGQSDGSLDPWSSLVGRATPDGESGDGGCDPCTPGCADSVVGRGFGFEDEDVPILRRLYSNSTELVDEPWHEGESVRWQVLQGRVNTLQFNCGGNHATGLPIPNVCQNMCFGINCKGFSNTLTVSKAKPSCQAARKLNSCGSSNPNRCSTRFTPAAPAGLQCDEYPFASTLQGQQPPAGSVAATRCVPATENRSQGGKISGLFRTLNDGTQFDVEFDFAGAPTGYCVAPPNTVCATPNTQTGQM